MDYIFWSALRGNVATNVVVSYDIACSWYKNLMARRSLLPDFLSRVFVSQSPKFTFIIPKFHIIAHGKDCQDKFSLNYLRGMARTDGENIERGWAWMNPASLGTREMGLGARYDTLDDQWGYWNWRILVQLGACIPEYTPHYLLFIEKRTRSIT